MHRVRARHVATSVFAVLFALTAWTFTSAAIPHSVTRVYVACMNSLGSIRVIDHQAGKRCTSKERTISWNQRGPTGARGPQGDPGPTGAPGQDGSDGADGGVGPAGVSGYEVVSGDFVMALNVESGTSSVDCPTGKVPISGGYDYSGLFANNVNAKWENFVGASYPTATGWTVKWWHNMSSLVINFSVYAVCAAA